MPSHRSGIPFVLVAALVLAVAASRTEAAGGKKVVAAETSGGSYYKDHPQFHPYPDENSKAPQAVYRFGPVGIGVELTLPAFGMRVKNVEEGSPAEHNGKLQVGQIIESINGQVLQDIDPRVFLGNIITKAEATDGVVTFMLKQHAEATAEAVTVKIPVLGAYSKTWPLNCPKSAKIVRGEADYLAKNGNHCGALGHDMGLLFLLSTGEEQDLAVARSWVQEIVATRSDVEVTSNWDIGYGAPTLCEYYLRTGDATVLPIIEKYAAQAARVMYNGAWNHRNKVNFKYGHMNAAGVHCVKFLLLAKECGVTVDEYTLQTSLQHFFRFAGRGNVAYGDGMPEGGFVDNGKVGGLAFVMAAAASLTPEGEKSIYAKARDISAVKSFYSTSWMLHGHTGGGIGEVWRSSAMGLLYDQKPTKYREFMDGRAWHYDLSRRYNGAMTILRDSDYSAKYDNEMWGAGYALTYTIPRKTLRMTGAPPTKYSKTYALPQRPWGVAADDAFYSLAPAPDKNGKLQDVDAEKLVTDASGPLLRKLNDPKVSDEVLLKYAHHPEYGMRQAAALAIRTKERDYLILELLKDKDPRVRQAGLMVLCIDGFNTTYLPAERMTGPIVECLGKMIADPAESWWVVENAMMALSLAKPEQLAPHVDALLGWLKHPEWWLQRAALTALTPVVADARFSKKILPAIADMAGTNTVGGVMGPLYKIMPMLSKASPEVQKIALASFARAYETFPMKLKAPGGVDMQDAELHLRGGLAADVVAFPGGFDLLYKISRKVLPDEALPYRDLYFNAETAKFGPELARAMPAIVRENVVPEYIGEHLAALQDESHWATVQEKKKHGFAVGALDGLANLYREINSDEYDWRLFGPARDKIYWDYTSFDLSSVAKEKNDKINNPKVYVDSFEHALAGAVKMEAEAVKIEAAATQAEASATTENAKKTAMALRAKAKSVAEKARAARQTANEGFLAGALPSALENWFAPEFAAKKAGWKSGLAPFANVDGKLAGVEWHCKGNFCGCGEKPNTLWEKGVLLMRTTLNLPPLKKDYRYRLLLGGNIHSKQGDAVTIYINGKAFSQQGGFGGRLRPEPRGVFIDLEMANEFKGGKVLIAIAALKPEKAYLSAWLEEMKMPPVGENDIAKALARAPMLCAAWQELQDPDSTEDVVDPSEGKYHYKGRFVDNPRLRGNWTVINQVATIGEFVPGKAGDVSKAPFKTLSFNADGKTGDALWIWSGDMLMSLERKEALGLTLAKVGLKEYLFVEAGCFDAQNPKGWQSPLCVLERTRK